MSLAEVEGKPEEALNAVQETGQTSSSLTGLVPAASRGAVDPESITVEDIKRFEALMKGKAVAASSNATAPRGLVAGRDGATPLYQRHTWLADGEKDFGPLEIRFESRVNLISLNLDLTFSCEDRASLLEQSQRAVPNEEQISAAGSSLITEDLLGAFATSRQEDPLKSLGPFTVKNADESWLGEEARAAKASSSRPEDEGAPFLPLIVHRHRGAQFNSSHQVNTIVLDNSQVFASNYARPEFYFRHLHGETMTIDSFTVRSQPASRCGAYPVGRGLIFMADSLESFEQTVPFHKFTADDYQRWKQARTKDPRPLRPCEPVAFFEFDERQSLTVDVDFKRPCRYIMLKPTGFRSKPHHFRQSVNDLPMELEYFGALGSSRPRDAAADYCSQGDPHSLSGSGKEPLSSGHTVVISDLDSGEELLRLGSVQLSHLRLADLPLDGALGSDVTPIGQALMRVSDPSVSLRTLGGLSVRIIQEDAAAKTWRLRGASLVGVVTQAGQLPSLDRSYLMSPEHFHVINRTLALMVFDSKCNRELTASITKFLTKLVAHDYHFAALILDAIDLRKFIEVNLLTNNQTHIQVSVDFLRCFQRESRFARGLFEILIDMVQGVLPTSVPPQRGYDALMGMLSWAMPLDVELTLSVLLSTLYTTICKGCLPAVQTPECVDFRTRLVNYASGDADGSPTLSEHFPFDTVLLRPLSSAGRAAADSGSSTAGRSGAGGRKRWPGSAPPKGVLEYGKAGMCQTFVAKFARPCQVDTVQLFFGDSPSVLYGLEVVITANDVLLYRTFLSESAFARYVRYRRTGSKEADESSPGPEECLRMPLAGSEACSEMTVKLMYRYSSTSLGGKAASLPAAIAEFYGSYAGPGEAEEARVAYLEQVAEFEKSAASLQQVGQSVRMLTAALPGKPGWKRLLPFLVEHNDSGDSPAGKEGQEGTTGTSLAGEGSSLVLETEVEVQHPDAEDEAATKLLALQTQLKQNLK